MLPRRYGDREVARILERAAELQRAEPSAADPGGLTLDDLADIAREAGIDPGLLRRAASEVESKNELTTLGDRLAGAPVAIRLERVVDGEIPPHRLDELIPLIQAATDGQGTASAVGRTLTWSSHAGDGTSSQQVLVTCQDGRTMIRWEERFGGLVGALYGGIFAGGGIGAGLGIGTGIGAAIGSVAFAVGVPVLMMGGSYVLARTIFARVVRGREARANRVLDEIAAYVDPALALPRG